MFKIKKKKEKKSIISRIFNYIFIDEEEYEKKKEVESKKRFTTFEMVVVGGILLIFGVICGCLVTIFTPSVIGAKLDAKTMEFLKTYNSIKEDYYDDVNEDALIDSAISGMIGSLGDEHSTYMDQSSTNTFNNSVEGKYVGVGITIKYENDITTIIDIFKDSPADKDGLKVGDVIVEVNGVDVTGNDSNEIASIISGDVGKVINLVVLRDNEKVNVTTALAEIELDSVYTEVKESNNKKIGYIQITNFASNTYKQFNKKLKALEKDNIDSLIIDVRGNTGGHLSVVTEILDLFFDKDTVLYQIQDKKSTTKYSAKRSDKRDYPVVVLTNHGSASASEILASCFKERYKDATIVGTTTYGKGTVQKTGSLSDGSSYKFTTQKWLTSKGKWINEKGVTPDVEVELGDNLDEDLQLNEAIKILENK